MSLKQKWPYALFCGLAFSISFLLFGPISIFAVNRGEFMFALRDFLWLLLGITLIAAVAATALILFTRGVLSRLLFGFFVCLTVTGYLQGAFLNVGLKSLLGDDSDLSVAPWLIAVNALIWLALLAAFLFFSVKMKKIPLIRSAFVIALIIVMSMELTEFILSYQELDKSPFETAQSGEDEVSYLTTRGLDEVSAGKNILVFILDRFDISYYESLVESDPDFFEPLKGFTYFTDNISLYSRTYPAACTMITGLDTDWTRSREDYFSWAYGSSDFLRQLKEEKYRIKLYADYYYVYGKGDALSGIADNLSRSSTYTVTEPLRLVRNMIRLSLYKTSPFFVKSWVRISSADFSDIVEVNTQDPRYVLNDAEVFRLTHENGLHLDDSDNSYMFLHLSGCHDPYNMTAEGEYREGVSSSESIRGCFRLIYDYLGELRRLGVFDDATIVITGDHPRARDDGMVPSQPRLTALFVKPAGADGTSPLAYSDAQVSQENLIPTLAVSAGLPDAERYGRTYFDISEEETAERWHKFELYSNGTNYIVRMKVTGNGHDFNNWSEDSREEIGNLYK